MHSASVASEYDVQSSLSCNSANTQIAIGQAVADNSIIEDGDVIMVCVSGGKDSHTMLELPCGLQRRAPVRFRLIAFDLDRRTPGLRDQRRHAYFESICVKYRIETDDTCSTVKNMIPKGTITCDRFVAAARHHLPPGG